MKFLQILFLSFLCLPLGVLAQKEKESFNDDVVSYRPLYKYEKPVFHGIPKTLEIKTNSENLDLPDSLLAFNMDITKKLNKMLDYVPEKVTVKISKPGYRVQVYVGKDRNDASRAKGRALNMQKEEEAYLDYDRPNYRVKVGNFLTREDARELYKYLKRHFPDAMIVPDQVTVVKLATPDELLLLQKKEWEKKKGGN
ncbi:MAG: SPOR domain-containing protein [Raineya sp.]|jgi:hypothetical protein|nr:SPOR domain-containing protein [Raineya sp.]